MSGNIRNLEKPMRKKRNLSTLILVLIFLVGVAVLLYPTVSDWWNDRVQTQAIVDYESVLAGLDEADYKDEFERADTYNAALAELAAPLTDYGQAEGYEEALNVAGNGMIGYLTVPRLGLELPIYHGTDSSVLNVAVGHLEGSSLPVGGEGTHCVLSAHRGLPSAKLFSDLDKLSEGDIFTITVLDRLLTYEVDQIRIVEPKDVGELAIRVGKDYCTLVTCTPYGINTHRLLVRGHRTDNAEEDEIVIRSEAYELDSTLLAPVVAAPLLLILLVILLIKYQKPKQGDRRKPHKDREEKENHE